MMAREEEEIERLRAMTTATSAICTPYFPAALKVLRQWVMWKYENRHARLTKVPYCPLYPTRRASVTNTRDWGRFEEAITACEDGYGDGIGFVFTKDDPFCGVDLDKCRNPKTGAIDLWAQEIIHTLNSYTEISPSGTGVHIIVQGELPPGPNRKGQIEMYDQGRYFCMTGHLLHVAPREGHDER